MRKPHAPRPEVYTGGADEVEEDWGDEELPEPVPPAASRGALVPVAGGRGAVSGRVARERRDRVVSTGLTDRLAERRRAQRRLRLRLLGRVTAIVVGVVALVWAALFSPLLALRTSEIVVRDSDGTVDAAAVQEVLAHHGGTSLLRLDVVELGDEVAQGLVRVRSASVTRSWPHGLDISLTMRVPVVAHQVEGGYEVLDVDAVVLETVEQAPAGLVPITAADGEALTSDQVSAVALVVGSLEPATRSKVVSGSASATGQVTLTLSTGASVVWGDTSDTELKAEVLAVLVQHTASVYDVSSPRSPTTS
ncbi:cell division protein FtsQ/DivIB [Actinomyces oricola]|uniref:cell division protein FtsQ/DivIB n=1 Tax=Actinomyces oricola TaxID=206043 RepID=UPI000FFEBA13|nr:FtsQ-type POTRA domain-containing protein [Actinomyces oricola]